MTATKSTRDKGTYILEESQFSISNNFVVTEHSPQGKATSTLGNKFSDNMLVTAFNNDSLYFSGVTSVGTSAFRNTAIVFARFPFATSVSAQCAYSASTFYNCKSLVGLLFESTTSIGGLSYGSTTKYNIITTSSIPTLASERWLVGKVYVLDNLVNDYKATTGWSIHTILPLSQLPADYPDCPWLQELRGKGLIP